MSKCGFNRPKLENKSFIIVDSGRQRWRMLCIVFINYTTALQFTIYHCSHQRSHEIIMKLMVQPPFLMLSLPLISRKRDDKQRGYEKPGLRIAVTKTHGRVNIPIYPSISWCPLVILVCFQPKVTMIVILAIIQLVCY